MTAPSSVSTGGRRILLIVVLVLALACFGVFVIFGLSSSATHSASALGVTDPEKAALAVDNNTTDFYVLGITIIRSDGLTSDLGSVTIGGRGVFAVDPGEYDIRVRYSDHPSLENLSGLTWYVDSTKTGEFTVAKKRAAVFSLEGGSESGIMYEPPDLVRK